MLAKIRNLWVVVALIAFVGTSLPVPRAAAQSGPPSRSTIPTAVPSPILPIVPTIEPGYSAPHVAPSTANIVGVTQQPFVGLGLQDAIGMALLKNPNLAVSASDARIAGYQVTETKGAFDLRLQVQPVSNFSVQPPTNPFNAGPGESAVYHCVPLNIYPCNSVPSATLPPETRTGPGNIIQHQYSLQYGLGGQTENGTQYVAGIQQTRTYNNTAFDSFDPYYIASLNVSVTQPLLRNSGMNAAKRQFKLAIINSDQSTAQSLVDASNTISQVEDAYWNLVSAWRNVAIQEEALKDAVAQQQSTVRLARRGAAAPIDATESSTQVAAFQDNVFSALQTVAELQNQLKGLIVTDAGDPIWRSNLVPTSSVQQFPNAPTLEAIVTAALKNRPEVQQALDKYKQAEIDLAFAKNQSLPQADAQITYMSNGFAGLLQPSPAFVAQQCPFQLARFCPTPPPYTQGTMAEAYHNLWTFRYPTFNIGVTVSFPVQNDLAKGLKGIAHEEQQQAAVLTAGVAARIGFDARNALQTYQSALSRFTAARSAREASDQVYASEQRKFRNGASTTFLVLQRQVELNQNRGRELLAQTDFNKAMVEIERVEGTILTKNGVNVQTLGTQALAGSPAPLPVPSRLPTPSPMPS